MPPLDCLVFFEAAARHQSFTACCNELLVSQAAVSKRIRQLEDWIGQALFFRIGKRLLLTQAGEKLYETSGTTLEFLKSGIRAVSNREDGAVSLGANSAVTMFWLTPHLRTFGLSDSSCSTKLIMSDVQADVLKQGCDLAILYGSGDHAGWQCKLLFEEQLVPVASPALAGKLSAGTVKSLRDIHADARPALLNYARMAPDWIDWISWADTTALPEIKSWPMQQCSTYAQSIGEAISGRGIALGNPYVVSAELKAGALVRIGEDVFTSPKGYYLAYPKHHPIRSNTEILMNFLLSKAGQ